MVDIFSSKTNGSGQTLYFDETGSLQVVFTKVFCSRLESEVINKHRDLNFPDCVNPLK